MTQPIPTQSNYNTAVNMVLEFINNSVFVNVDTMEYLQTMTEDDLEILYFAQSGASDRAWQSIIRVSGETSELFLVSYDPSNQQRSLHQYIVNAEVYIPKLEPSDAV